MTLVSFTPSPTVREFMLDQSLIRIIMGPFGSGKSSGCCIDIWRRAVEQPANADGLRHSRWAIVRTTARQLLDTTLVTWLKWFPDGVAGRYMKTSKTFIAEYMIEDGTWVKAEYMFRALDDAEDVKNLASLEINGAYMNELKESDKAIFDAMKGRIGRFVPQGIDPKATPVLKLLIADTNPPIAADYDWCYQLLEVDALKEEWAGRIAVFKQPSGLAPDAENLDFLPGGRQYYEDMCIGATEEFIRVNVHGQYGTALGGKTVFEKSWSPALHISRQPLKPLRTAAWGDALGVVIGMDFGLTPSAIVMQMAPSGQLRILDEVIGDNIGLRQFLRRQLKPLIAARYEGVPILVVGDPAGGQRSQADETTCYDILAEEGFFAQAAGTNALVKRLGAVEDKLRVLVDNGEPAIIISSHCHTLIKGFNFGYRYKEIARTDGSVYTTPEKNQYSHPMDALQYGVMHADEAGVPMPPDEDDDYAPVATTTNSVTGY